MSQLFRAFEPLFDLPFDLPLDWHTQSNIEYLDLKNTLWATKRVCAKHSVMRLEMSQVQNLLQNIHRKKIGQCKFLNVNWWHDAHFVTGLTSVSNYSLQKSELLSHPDAHVWCGCSDTRVRARVCVFLKLLKGSWKDYWQPGFPTFLNLTFLGYILFLKICFADLDHWRGFWEIGGEGAHRGKKFLGIGFAWNTLSWF